METFTITNSRRARFLLFLPVCAMLACTLAGCAQPTSLESQSQSGKYAIDVSYSPPLINPKQFSNLSFAITDKATGKPVKAFEPVDEALLHTVTISHDLQDFHHSYTNAIVDNIASVDTYYPEFATYYAYTLFKPSGDDLQIITSTISAGKDAGESPELQENVTSINTQGWLTFQLVKEPGEIKAGEPTQLVFNVKEHGGPVTALWPYLGAPGQLWIVDQNGDNFAHLTASSEAHPYVLTPVPGLDETPVAGEPTSTKVEVPPSPTYAPGVAAQLAVVEALPTRYLAPVQQTPQSSILTTPEVVPGIGYGPNLAFTHTFPHAGMYKMWLEVQYRDKVVTVPYVVKVVE